MFNRKIKFLTLVSFFILSLFVIKNDTFSQVSPIDYIIRIGKNYEQPIGDLTNQFEPPEILHSQGKNPVIYEDQVFEFNNAKFDDDGDLLFYFYRATGGEFKTLYTGQGQDRFERISWTPPQVSQDKDFFIYAMAGDGRGAITESYFTVRVKNRSGGTDPINPVDPGDGDSNFQAVNPELTVLQYPLTKLSFGLMESGNLNTTLTHNEVQLFEGGEQNIRPSLFLPPREPSSKMDLLVLIDKTGNTREYQEQIRANVQNFIDYIRSQGIDLKVTFGSYGNQNAHSGALDSYLSSDQDLMDHLEGLNFDEEKTARAEMLSQLSYSVSKVDEDPNRRNAEKIALIVNGSQLNSKERDPASHYAFDEVVKHVTKKFTTFVIGHPIKQNFRIRKGASRVQSLSQSVSGGYLGSFNTDLTLIYELLKSRKADQYTVAFYSKYKNPSEAINKEVKLKILDKDLFSLSYDSFTVDHPTYEPLPLKKLKDGKVDFEIDVHANNSFINLIELGYSGIDGKSYTYPMVHQRHFSGNSIHRYMARIPQDHLYEDFAYEVRIYTPFNYVDHFNTNLDQTLVSIDEGIHLVGQKVISSGTEGVMWKWSGPTVAMGKSFELWSGDTQIAEIKDASKRQFFVPSNECNLYQVAKVRVKLKSSADHPNAGGFSLFSREAEYFTGTDLPINQKELVELGMKCLNNAEVTSMSAFLRSKPSEYQSTELANLVAGSAILTRLMDRVAYADSSTSNFAKNFNRLGYLSDDDYGQHWEGKTTPLRSIFYKMITKINNSSRFLELYKAVNLKSHYERLGNMTI